MIFSIYLNMYSQKWAEQWIYVQQRADGQNGVEVEERRGLDWLLTLWSYRDPEVKKSLTCLFLVCFHHNLQPFQGLVVVYFFKVRVAGLGIGVAMTSTDCGRTVLTSHCTHIPGGVWGVAFSILLDQSECSMVRQQAALLLVNMTSQSMPCGSVELEENVWQGPVVADTESKVGLSSLQLLIRSLNF